MSLARDGNKPTDKKAKVAATTTAVQTLPVFDLQTHHQKVEVPEDFDLRDLARKLHVFPLKMILQSGRKRLLLAMQNPYDQKAIHDVEFRAGMTVVPVQADNKDIQWLIQTHYFGRKLSPSPSPEDEHSEITHNLFEQLEMTTDSQKRPAWVSEILQNFYTEENDEEVK